LTDLSNVIRLDPAGDAFEGLVMAVAAGELAKESVIDRFRAHAVSRSTLLFGRSEFADDCDEQAEPGVGEFFGIPGAL